MACRGTKVYGNSYITVCGSSYNSSTIVASTVEQQYFPIQYRLYLERQDASGWTRIASRTGQNLGSKNYDFVVPLQRRTYRIAVHFYTIGEYDYRLYERESPYRA